MTIRNLLIDRREPGEFFAPENLLFSFLADTDAEYRAEICTPDGTAVASRTVTLADAPGFRFAGLTLLPGRRYRFRVLGGETAAEAEFETAVAFSAPFITPARPVPSPRLVRRFRLPEDARQLRLAITGLGLYRAELNGKRVGDRYLTPGCNDYDAYVRFDTYRVDALCLPGEENLLTVELGDGWYRGRYGIDKAPEAGGKVWGDAYLCALMLYEADGGRVLLTGDTAFSAVRSACAESSIYDGEVRDLTRDAGEPVPCRIADRQPPAVPFFGAPVRVREVRTPTLLRTPGGAAVLDFGVNMVGFVRMTARLPRGTRVTVRHGEVLQDGEFYRDNLRTAKAEAVYVSDGQPHTYEPYFTFFGFRYAEIEGLETVDPNDFRGVVLSSDTGDASAFSASDPRLVRLTENTRRSQLGNFLDIPTDCPQRDERLGWTADTQVFAASACYGSDCYAFYEKYLRDLRYEQVTYYGGDLPMYAPSLRGEAGHGGAVWADCATILPTVLYRFYGDRGQLARDYPLMRDYCALLLSRDRAEGDRGLITDFFTFGDWLAQDGICAQALSGGTDTGYISSLYYYRSLSLTAGAAEVLGLASDCARFRAAAERVRGAILNAFFTGTGRLALDTQTAYVLALRFGVYRDRRAVIDGLRERLRRDLFCMKTGFCGTPLLLPALFDAGLDDDAYRILFSPDCPGWFYALGLGATTIWERWNTLLPDGRVSGTSMNSLNHYAYGSVCEAIYGDIVGLRPGAPGWRSAEIVPHPNYRLKHAGLVFRSPAGVYSVRWEVTEDGRFLLDVSVPAGCTAVAVLPGSARENLGSGARHFDVPAPSHLLHPFSLDTPNLDVVRHPAAAACLRGILPRAWAMVTGENREFLARDGHFLLSLPMFGATLAAASRYRRALEEVRG